MGIPRGREVGGKIAWVESEIDEWISELPVKKLKGEPGAKPWRAMTKKNAPHGAGRGGTQ
jgi:hypothetical protein